MIHLGLHGKCIATNTVGLRLLDLALAGGRDLSAAERAIGLSGEPTPLVESLIENLLSRSDYRAVVPWLHFLIEHGRDEERSDYAARLFELGLGFLEDGRVAEEALGFVESQGESRSQDPAAGTTNASPHIRAVPFILFHGVHPRRPPHEAPLSKSTTASASALPTPPTLLAS